MNNIAYKESWLETNPASEESTTEINLDIDIDNEEFTDEQLLIINDWYLYKRKELTSKLLDFILKPIESMNADSTKNRYATSMKVLCRVVLLNKLLNDDETPYSKLPQKYGISNHSFYDERNVVIDELSSSDKNIGFYIRNNQKKKGKNIQ